MIIRGREWTERREESSDTYIAAYMPIADVFEKRVGMLSVAVSESNYSAVQRKLIFVFIAATCAGGIDSHRVGVCFRPAYHGPGSPAH